MGELKFFVAGTPAPMGSKKGFVVKDKRTGKQRAIITDDNKPQRRRWANAVSSKASEVMNGGKLIDGPVRVVITYLFSRPKSHYGTGRNAGTLKNSAPTYHSQSPDLDKLIRCTNDALTKIVFGDDRQIASLSAAREWTESQEGAWIRIIPMESTTH